MSDKERQTLSALMDGELSGPHETEAVDGLLDRADLRECWARYHMVRAVLRQELGQRVESTLLVSLRVRIEREPAHGAPPRRARAYLRAILAPAGGLALAASVAVVAILGIRDQNAASRDRAVEVASTSPAAEPAGAPAAPRIARATVGMPPGTQITGEARPAAFDGGPGVAARPALETRLNRYLVRHSEYLGGGMRGMLPYARIVGHDESSSGR